METIDFSDMNIAKLAEEFYPGLPQKKDMQFGDWKVTPTGDISHKDYHIPSGRLKEENWFIHLLEKDWVNWNDFIRAYYQACANAGIEEFTMITKY